MRTANTHQGRAAAAGCAQSVATRTRSRTHTGQRSGRISTKPAVACIKQRRSMLMREFGFCLLSSWVAPEMVLA